LIFDLFNAFQLVTLMRSEDCTFRTDSFHIVQTNQITWFIVILAHLNLLFCLLYFHGGCWSLTILLLFNLLLKIWFLYRIFFCISFCISYIIFYLIDYFSFWLVLSWIFYLFCVGQLEWLIFKAGTKVLILCIFSDIEERDIFGELWDIIAL
jgi:hypothetical protein